ncbi:4-hydroxy-tetrahydrodipicolinate synthase [Oceanidesulfovibrio indonesiensis]|uniref:4-hydroxy-tetrahydrodipicolinate synthase n=1 Tax=Oceanidesulfovibrio indonesiensis TaxID=54767 RepID=A0A7M3MIZ3_9BACT|nr:4-hydroxy-tetrahydrodipicolinate synthase [Oceanidesulfovibrio indonesiensis]TVM19427.1 4-hydroxy-tetrahydrodipicolinate synthase [Oceanidesulfovibrio indonesiensis]
MQFRGALTALVTPFRNGAFDEEAYRAFIDWQIEQGIDGVVPCGTTGESATLSHEEHKRVVRTCVEHVAGRVPVLAGAGSNNTKEAIELAKDARDVGADGLLLITPYYNKPTQEGLYQHFKAIAAEVDLPFIVYNVPGRTGVNLLPETLARMARDIPQVVGTKDATANLRQVSDIAEQCGKDFMLLSGDDFTVLPLLSVGGCGVISVVSNIAPAWMAGLCKAFEEGDLEKAREYHFKLQPLSRGCFLETNPSPAKTALSMMGRIPMEFRLPMVPLQPENEEKLKKLLADAGLI